MKRWPDSLVIALLAALAIGGLVRFAWLGAPDISSDETGLLLRLGQSPTAAEIVDDHLVQFATFKALPLARLAALAAVGDGPLEPGRLRFAFALAGLLGIAAMAWLAYELGGAPLASIAALVTALNPFHLYWSKVAHVTVFNLLLGALFYAAAIRLATRLVRDGRASPGLWTYTTLIAIAAGLCHITLWPALLLAWGFPIAALWAFQTQHRNARSGVPNEGVQNRTLPVRTWLPVLLAPGAWLLSLLPWAERWWTAWSSGLLSVEAPTQAFWRGLPELGQWPLLVTFGDGWRIVLSLGLPALALISLRTRIRATMLVVFGACLFVPLTWMQSPGAPTLGGYGPLWPVLVMLISLGALAAADELRLRWLIQSRALVTAGALGLAAISVVPVQALIELRGRPAELSRLALALDELVVEVANEGTPALVNGRSIVEYEMRPHPPRRAAPTFIANDASFEEWRDGRWRESAEDFLRRFPDAFLVQQGRRYYEHSEVGPWAFPESHFARRLVLENRPAQRLAELGLAPVADFYGPRTVTEISYNHPEDLVERALQNVETTLALWGDGWLYAKTADSRDWRVLERRAELKLHNLTAAVLPIQLRLDVLTPAGRKRLHVDDQPVDVPRSDDDQELLLNHTLEPGEQTLVIEDRLYEVGAAPLYVASISIEIDTGK